ncbi:MAG: hypothetical protein ACI91J_001413, partial [Yoonia sp.]
EPVDIGGQPFLPSMFVGCEHEIRAIHRNSVAQRVFCLENFNKENTSDRTVQTNQPDPRITRIPLRQNRYLA